jgi:hypothetical protein
MSKSNKPRYGTGCKLWKDTVLASRSQKRAWTKRKQITTQQRRRRAAAQLRTELAAKETSNSNEKKA